MSPRNLRRDPRVTVFVLDPDDPFRWISVTGHAELDEEGPVAHIDKLVKYTGVHEYRVPERGEQRRIVRVPPGRVNSRGL